MLLIFDKVFSRYLFSILCVNKLVKIADDQQILLLKITQISGSCHLVLINAHVTLYMVTLDHAGLVRASIASKSIIIFGNQTPQ
jgi:hypothetical protein